jgi:trimethyllysine dioxygenase
MYEIIFADGHRTVISYSSIAFRNNPTAHANRHGLALKYNLWTSTISKDPPTVSYEAVQAGPGMAELMRKIRHVGFCFVENTPPTPEATEALLASIGPIRNTHYGGFYDFIADLSSKDTAYTSEALEPHTDNTYFSDPAGLQALHLLSHTSGNSTSNDALYDPSLGGENCLVDGFAAAKKLKAVNQRAHTRTLSNQKVYAHASGNEGISIQPDRGYPVLNYQDGMLTQVRWNTADRAGLKTANWDAVELWYEAASLFNGIVNDKQNQYWFQLTPGKLLSKLERTIHVPPPLCCWKGM